MNSNLAIVMAVYEGILKDASILWPTSTKSFGKDLSYLRRAAEQRGLGFFTLTLPEFGKVLDRSLSRSAFLASEVPQGIPQIKKRPELFGDLYMKVFNDSGTLRLDYDIDAIAFLRQLTYCFKKFRIECDPKRVEATISDFYSIESDLPASIPETWDSDIPVWHEMYGHPHGRQYHDSTYCFSDTSGLPWETLSRLSKRFMSELGLPDHWDLLPKHGPGVVSEQEGFISKYEFPNWPRKLGLWFPYDWFGPGVITTEHEYSEMEPPSRLIAVPKTQKGPRLICAEPISHQWMQQSTWRWLEKRIRKTSLGKSIRFRDQEFSRMRALEASLDGKLCTIDLSAASDRLSTRLVQYIFQGPSVTEGSLLDNLHAHRTRYLSQTLSENCPKTILLRKFAPMGSAVTFPVQSIVFTILALWGLKLSEGTERDFSNLDYDLERITVFGDDIIAPTTAYQSIELVLHECGLKVNADKSFSEGFFRESCGMDAFCGSDVTAAYILGSYDGSPSSMATTIESANNFHKRGYWNAAQAVVNFLPEKERKLLLIVGSEGGGLGLFSFCGRSTAHLKSRWNRDYHRQESIALTVTSKVTKTQGTGLSSLTQYFTERPDPSLPWSSGQVSRVKLRKGLTRVLS